MKKISNELVEVLISILKGTKGADTRMELTLKGIVASLNELESITEVKDDTNKEPEVSA